MTWGFGLKYIGAPVALIVCLFLLYTTGYNKGVEAIENERAADRRAFELQVADLNGQIKEREKAHVRETAEIQQALSVNEASYSDTLGRLRDDYAQRLRNSEERARGYLAFADSSSDECGALASHAARLDYSIEEGRSVVEELRSTLELRDSQLRLVGSQLIADRQLYEDYGNYSN